MSVHVLVVGAGGLGCPAAWGLAASGAGRITLLDPDVVERSNLPRQILFVREDLGRPKAPAAAAALPADVFAGGLHARFDDTNEAGLLDSADVVIDATDGAHAKDWLNQACVRRGVPFVHAAGLRSEARLLPVAAGGRPCLACLFGRLAEETGSCADLGVWNGVVGVAGFLAAHAALGLARGKAPSGYAVLDFESGRAMSLATAPREECPVCAGTGDVEPYPEPFACAVPQQPGGGVAATAMELDLREERCPMNLLRARQALTRLVPGARLSIALGAEGAATVPDGVRALGHRVLSETPRGEGLDLLVETAGAGHDDASFGGELLQEYARQIVLPEVGERGQRRLLRSTVSLLGRGGARESAAVYLRAAGATVVDEPTEHAECVAWSGGGGLPDTLGTATRVLALVREGDVVRASAGGAGAREDAAGPPAVELARGALLADFVQRHLVLADPPEATFGIGDDGVVG